MSNRHKKGIHRRVSLNCLVALVFLELLIFHFTFWDYTLTLFESSSSPNVILKPRDFLIYDEAFFNKTANKEDVYAGFDYDKMTMQEIIHMNSKTNFEFPAFDEFKSNQPPSLSHANPSERINLDVGKTIRVLAELGVTRDMMDKEEYKQLPPWSNIVDNFGSEPVILGLDRCEAYRQNVPIGKRVMAPAGLFSSGTNVLHDLLLNNCLPPPEIRKRLHFNQWQVPW